MIVPGSSVVVGGGNFIYTLYIRDSENDLATIQNVGECWYSAFWQQGFEGEEVEVACRGPAVSTARTAPSLAAAGRVAARHWPAAHRHPRSASRGSGGGSYWRTRVRAASVCALLAVTWTTGQSALRHVTSLRFVVNMVRPVSLRWRTVRVDYTKWGGTARLSTSLVSVLTKTTYVSGA